MLLTGVQYWNHCRNHQQNGKVSNVKFVLLDPDQHLSCQNSLYEFMEHWGSITALAPFAFLKFDAAVVSEGPAKLSPQKRLCSTPTAPRLCAVYAPKDILRPPQSQDTSHILIGALHFMRSDYIFKNCSCEVFGCETTHFLHHVWISRTMPEGLRTLALHWLHKNVYILCPRPEFCLL